MFHLNKPILSLVFSLAALFFGIAMMVGVPRLPERQSIQTFFILFPATLITAMLGYLLGAMSRTSRLSTFGYLIGGGVLVAIVIILMRPAF